MIEFLNLRPSPPWKQNTRYQERENMRTNPWPNPRTVRANAPLPTV